MPLLAIQEPGLSLHLRDGAPVVMKGERVIRPVPLHEIDEVLLFGPIELSARVRNLLLRHGIDILLFTQSGDYVGRMVSVDSPLAERRALQYRCLQDPGCALRLAQRLVVAKLANQRTFLQRVQRERPADPLVEAIVALRRLIAMAGEATEVEVLRGYEGYGAAMYFRAFQAVNLHPELSFCGRSRRPPRDPVNAVLSFAYGVFLRRLESLVRKSGLDPNLGALHLAGRGKPALALDLMEPFRPFWDRQMMRLINRRQLAPVDFCNPEVSELELGLPPNADATEASETTPADTAPLPPPVHLAATGRAIVLKAFGDAWKARHVHGEAHLKLAQIVERQVYDVLHFFESYPASDFQPFTLS